MAAVGMNSCMRLMVRINVDLPQPEGPINAVTVPAAKSREILDKAWCLPNQAWTPRVSSPVPRARVPGALTDFACATSANECGLTVVSIVSFSFSCDVVIWQPF